MPDRQAWLAVVQHGDDEPEETEVVTIEQGEGLPPVIELTDGTRITCVSPAEGRAA